MDFDPVRFLFALDWPGLVVPGLSIAEKILRILLVYTFLIVALRLAGKRELAQLNPFDFVVLLVLSNTLQNAVIGSDNSVLGGFWSAAALLAVNAGVNAWLARHPKAEAELVGRKRMLVQGGRVDSDALERESLTLQELEWAAHKQGLPSLDAVESAELDPDGELFFTAKASHLDERRHRELLARLDALQAEVAELRANPRR